MKLDDFQIEKMRRRKYGPHELNDLRILEMSLIAIEKIESEDNNYSLDRAKKNIEKWLTRSPNEKAFFEWKMILDNKEWKDIKIMLSEDDDNSKRLRQSSPFFTIIPENKRLDIIKKYSELKRGNK